MKLKMLSLQVAQGLELSKIEGKIVCALAIRQQDSLYCRSLVYNTKMYCIDLLMEIDDD